MAIPVQYPSCFNSIRGPNVFFDEGHWAVTMICNERQSRNHAMLIVEGVERATRKLWKVHLAGPCSVAACDQVDEDQLPPLAAVHKGIGFFGVWKKIGRVEVLARDPDKKVHHSHKSETWLKDAADVKRMLEEARQESEHPEKYPRAFNILGRESKFASSLNVFKFDSPMAAAFGKYDRPLFLNCYYYATLLERRDLSDQLTSAFYYPLGGVSGTGYNSLAAMLSIVYFEKYGNLSFTRTSGFPYFGLTRKIELENYQKLSDAVVDMRDHEQLRAFAGSLSGYERQLLDETIERLPKLESLQSQSVTMSQMKARALNILSKIRDDAKLSFLHAEVQELEALWQSDPAEGCRRIIYLAMKSVTLDFTRPDSCFTWGKEKLAGLDISVPSWRMDSIFSSTRRYLDRVFQED